MGNASASILTQGLPATFSPALISALDMENAKNLDAFVTKVGKEPTVRFPSATTTATATENAIL